MRSHVRGKPAGTVAADLHYVDSHILKRLEHLNVAADIQCRGKLIGRGAFGDVFKGILNDKKGREVKVAMKKLRLDKDNESVYVKKVCLVFFIA